MNIIYIEDNAFYALVETVIEQLKEKATQKEDKWLSGPEGMNLLRIKSKTMPQKLHEERKIHASQPERRIVVLE
jgi:hypothetical protein